MVSALKVVDYRPNLIDYSAVEEGVTSRQRYALSREHAFQRYVLETVFSVIPEEVDDHIVDGGGDRGIDIVFIDHPNRTINFCSTKTVVGFKQSQKNYPGKEVDKIISFVDDLLGVRERLMNSCTPHLQNKVRQVWELLEADHYDLKVHLFSNQLPLAASEARRLADWLSSQNVTLEEHHLYELAHGVARAHTHRNSTNPFASSKTNA